MRQAVFDYVDGLAPELDPDLLVEETITRAADQREALERILDQLTDEEREQVRAADRVLIREAARLAPWWRAENAEAREERGFPREHWWWWIDEIADGVFPRELLPEA
ncbi:MAG: hypothetical protein LDL07_04425 [Desulfarculus sp.]|nr:hypothetical protein [Desulfarculus sp.]